MGAFYYVQSVGLAEDLEVMEKDYMSSKEFYSDADQAYTQVWITFAVLITH